MASFERIMKRRRDADEAEIDDLRLVVLSRLAATNGDPAGHLPANDQRPVIVRRVNGGTPGGTMAHQVVGAEPQNPSKWLLVAPLDEQPATAAAPAAIDAGPSAPAEVDPLTEAPAATETPVFEVDPQDEAVDAADPEAPAQSRSGRRSARTALTDRVPVDPAAACPYCAVLLEPPPQTDDRCPRCRQPMIVRSVGARMAILTEAALPFFEAERLNEERWTGDRERWLALAHESGADGGKAPQLAGELVSEADVAAARSWYLASADRAFRVAESERRWEEAARIRYAQADVLSRIAGSPDSPSAEVVGLHRDGLAADLQALGEVARDAEVRGESCCDACRLDDHRVVQIAEELASPTLPHDGCSDGLCRCRWFLTTRDQELIAALLRRQMGADRRTAVSPGDSGQDDALSEIA